MSAKSTTDFSGNGPSALHVELAGRIARLAHDDALVPGTRLNEKRLAKLLGVSRTPVRAALEHLAARGFVQRHPNLGVELLALPPLSEAVASDAGDELLARIATDRRKGLLDEQVSEQDLMQTYELSRVAVKQALNRLADLGVVERKLGYRWKFLDEAYHAQARAESYRFRMVVEPSAISEPGFRLPDGWAAQMRSEHEAFKVRRWVRASSVTFFEMNARFHEGLAKASGNRFFLDAVRRMTRLRRLSNYDWNHGRDRVAVSCDEHLGMLDSLERGEVEHAALLMRRHLESARSVSS